MLIAWEIIKFVLFAIAIQTILSKINVELKKQRNEKHN